VAAPVVAQRDPVDPVLRRAADPVIVEGRARIDEAEAELERHLLDRVVEPSAAAGTAAERDRRGRRRGPAR
jgi:hypothetical protein